MSGWSLKTQGDKIKMPLLSLQQRIHTYRFLVMEPSQNISKSPGGHMSVSPVSSGVCVCGLWSNCCHSVAPALISACQLCLGGEYVNGCLRAVKCRWRCWHMDLRPQGGGQMLSRGQEGQDKDNGSQTLLHTGTTGQARAPATNETALRPTGPRGQQEVYRSLKSC